MKIQVVGAGGWGLALARLLALNHHDVRLWCREEDNPSQLRETRESPVFLPGVKLPESIEVSTETDPNAALAVLAVPSHAMRAIVTAYPFSGDTIRVSVAKGIENESLCTMTQVIAAVSGDVPVAVLSGPTHAEEVSREKPSSIVAAAHDQSTRTVVQNAFGTDYFRVYTASDVIGVELGGSLKNVIAIAAGVCDGFELGDNARAALITRGLAEISRLGVTMGADPLTFSGLSGMGDLIATCTSAHSRNHALGQRIAQGMSPEQAVAASPLVAEGVKTAKSAYALARRHHVDMPITEQVHAVLYEHADPREAVAQLMMREPKPERH